MVFVSSSSGDVVLVLSNSISSSVVGLGPWMTVLMVLAVGVSAVQLMVKLSAA